MSFGEEPNQVASGQAKAVREIKSTPTETKPTSYKALLIGINGYTGTLTPLEYCVKDMNLLAETFEKIGVAPENMTKMTDDATDENLKPTLTNILTQMDILTSDASENDTIIIAFSGHGVHDLERGKNYLYPKDANPRLVRTLISYSDIDEMLSRSKAKRKLFLIDACRNTLLKGAKAGQNQNEGFNETFDTTKGTAFLLSCSQQEHSWELDELNHGVFTYFISKGLSGEADINDDGQISLQELNEYVKEQTKKTVWEKNRANQTPILRTEIADDAGNFILARLDSFGKPRPKTKTKWLQCPVFGALGRHLGKITAVAFGPDDKTFVTGGIDGTVRLWDTRTGKNIRIFNSNSEERVIYDAKVSPNNKYLAASCSGRSGKIFIWDITTGKMIGNFASNNRRYTKEFERRSLVFSPDSKTLLSLFSAGETGEAERGEVILWDVETGKKLKTWDHNQVSISNPRQLFQIVTFIDNSTIAFGGKPRQVFIRDVNTEKEKIERSQDGKTVSLFSDVTKSVAISQKTNTIISTTNEGMIKVRLSENGKDIAMRLHISRDNGTGKAKIVATRIDEKEYDERRKNDKSYILPVWRICYSSDSKVLMFVLMMSGGHDYPCVVRTKALEDFASGTRTAMKEFPFSFLAKEYFDPLKFPLRQAITANREIIASFSDRIRVTNYIWDMDTGIRKSVHQFNLPKTNSEIQRLNDHFVYSPDANLIAIADGEFVRIIEMKSGVEKISLHSHKGGTTCSSFLANNTQILTCGYDKTIRLWDVDSGHNIEVFNSDSDVYSLAVSLDGKRFVSSHKDGSIRLWDLETKKTLYSAKGGDDSDPVLNLVLSPNGQLLFSSTERHQVKLWKMEPLEIIRDIQKESSTVEFSPDGKYYLVADKRGNASLRLIEDDLPIAVFEYRNSENSYDAGPIYSSIFSPDGQNICTLHENGTLILWE